MDWFLYDRDLGHERGDKIRDLEGRLYCTQWNINFQVLTEKRWTKSYRSI